MIRSGTTCFNDMYWHLPGAVRAVEDSGIRGVLSSVFIDLFDGDKARDRIRTCERQMKDVRGSERVTLALGPHALYTVSEETISWAAEYARKNGLLIHFHASETEKEVKDCVAEHGKRPMEYLDSIGFLGPNVVLAHCVWLSDAELDIMARADVKVSHCPTSNMKLSVGRAIRYGDLKRKGINVSLGTDGCASNNNLDMLESAKLAALLQKHTSGDPTALDAHEAFEMATSNGAAALALEGGSIEDGKLADLCLVDLGSVHMCPGHHLVSDLVYSANGSCIDTMICDGKVIMQDGSVPGEAELIGRVRKAAADLVG